MEFEYNTREEAFEAAKAAVGCEVRLDEERSAHPGVRAVYATDDPEVYINDLNARFEACVHGQCRNFWVRATFTAEEVRRKVGEAWAGIQGVDEAVRAIEGIPLLPSDAKATILRVLRSERAALRSRLEDFVPVEALDI